MKKLIKRLTIRRRAGARGAEIRAPFGGYFTGSPDQNDACRTLVRLHRIRCGLPPFSRRTGRIGSVLVTETALEAFGNLRRT